MDPERAPSPSDAVEAFLRSHGVPEDVLAASRRVRALAFGGPSSSILSMLFDGKLEGEQAARAQALADACEALGSSGRDAAGRIALSCSLVEKPAKLGVAMSRARALFKGSFPEFAACALDARLLAAAGASREAPIEPLSSDAKQCLAMLARAAKGACRPLLASCSGRCCFEPMPEALAILLAHGFPPGGPCIHGHEPLWLLCAQPSRGARPGLPESVLACAALLAESGADLDKPCEKRGPPLSIAAGSGQPELCMLLLDAGADPFAIPGPADAPGEAPIHALLALPETAERARAAVEARSLAASLPERGAARARKASL